MTDHELNEAVAAARGWTRTEEGNGQSWGVPPHEQDPSSPWGGQSMPLPDIANDPAAWGALLNQLAEEGLTPALAANPIGWIATVERDGQVFFGASSGPGRALGMAYIKSRGVST